MAFSLNRRKFLTRTAYTLTGFGVAAGLGYRAFPALPFRGAATAKDAENWLILNEDGSITFRMPRAEMGQGIDETFKNIIASQIPLPFDKINIMQQMATPILQHKGTVGSDSIKDIAPLLLKISAAFNTKLAEKMPRLTTEEINKAEPKAYKETENSSHNVKAIISGEKGIYVSDIYYEGMVHGAIIRPPQKNMRLKEVSFNDTSDVKLLRLKSGRVALIAPSFYALQQAKEKLKISWEGGEKLSNEGIKSLINVDKSADFEHKIQKDKISNDKPFQIDLRFDIPMAAHAALEPRCAVAQLKNNRLLIDTASQDITYVQRHCAKELGLSRDAVFVNNYRMGGAFGGKTVVYPELDAAEIALHLNEEKPVRVQWTREDEFTHAFHRPPSSHRIKIRVNEKREISDYQHHFRSGHVLFTSSAMGTGLQFATSFVKDMGVFRGAVHPYKASNQSIAFEDVRLPIDTGPWRGLGAMINNFVIETAINELARNLKEDPLALRLRLIDNAPRLKTVLNDVARQAQWSDLKSSNEKAYGIACGIYKDASYVAVIAEVTLIGKNTKVTKLWCSHDCGQVFNKNKVKAQIEGNLMWGISSVFHEGLKIENGTIINNFHDYQIARLEDCPEINISLIDSQESPTGAGETAIMAGCAAITSAITTITGKVYTSLPLS